MASRPQAGYRAQHSQKSQQSQELQHSQKLQHSRELQHSQEFLPEGFLPDGDAVTAARAHAAELGCPAVSRSGGAALRFLAAAVRARTVVEVGTGAGVSGLYLLGGMLPDGVLTSIDVEPAVHSAARAAFARAGYAPGRARLIGGRALEVLPRLTHGGYDLVHIDAVRAEYAHYYEHGVGLLRCGGVLAFSGMDTPSTVAEPSRRSAEARALREVTSAINEDERLVPALLPVAGGLLVASRATDR